jgi:hypothetical protein
MAFVAVLALGGKPTHQHPIASTELVPARSFAATDQSSWAVVKNTTSVETKAVRKTPDRKGDRPALRTARY